MRPLRLAVVLALLGAACGGGSVDGPPEINYGRDVCVECNMIISEVAHAAAYRLADGTEKAFDGVGEMVKHGRTNDEFGTAEAWVHDYLTEEWVKAEDASYVPTLSVSSPMGHGIFAFADPSVAAEFAAGVDGQVVDWATVLQLPIVDGMVGSHHADGSEEPTDGGHEDGMNMEDGE